MKNLAAMTGLALLLAGCSNSSSPTTCPAAVDVAPASLGGEAFVTGLTRRLAGGDRENSITEAIRQIHDKAPQLDSNAIADILIAADCPNAAALPDQSEAAINARIATFRAQVEALLGA